MEYKIIFSWIIGTSIKGSILIGAILLMKGLFKNNMGAKWHYYIWFLLLARLYMPYVPQSSMSIFNIFSFYQPGNMIIKDVMYYNPQEIIRWFDQSNDLFRIDGVTNQSAKFAQYIDFFIHSSVYFKLILIWFIGGVGLSFYTIKTNIGFYLKLKLKENKFYADDESMIKILEDCKEKMRIHKRIQLIITKEVKSPAIFGWMHPKLLFPVRMYKKLTPLQLQYVFLHELAHFKRKDILVYWMSAFLQIVHWFNPIILYGFYQMRQDCEIACDGLALSYLDEKECTEYGQTILCLLGNMKKPLSPIGMAGISSSKLQLKRRITMITLFKKYKYKLSIVATVILVMMSCILLTNATEVTTSFEKQKEVADPLAKKEMMWPLPASKEIISDFGKKKHPKFNKLKMHTGMDIKGEEGKEIIAATDGVVIHAEELGGYGNTVIIDHGDGLVSLYGHCSEILVKKDSKVKAGDKIAKVGSTGYSTGPHLHFEVRQDEKAVDPKEYLKDI